MPLPASPLFLPLSWPLLTTRLSAAGRALRRAVRQLQQCGVGDAQQSAKLLFRLCRAAQDGASFGELLRQPLSAAEDSLLQQLVQRRSRGCVLLQRSVA